MLGNVDPEDVNVEALSTTVYRGYDNVTEARFTQFVESSRRDVALDFSTITRAVLIFPDLNPPIKFDTLEVGDVIQWAGLNPGTLRFDLAQYQLDEGVYNAELVVYDAQHPAGQVIVSRYVPRDEFKFNVTSVGTTGGTPPTPMPQDPDAVVRTAGVTLSALRLVWEGGGGNVYPFTPSNGIGVNLLLGITITAGAPGAKVLVKRWGTIDDPGFLLPPGLVFCGPDGTLVTNSPTIGWEVVVGTSPSAGRLNLDFDEPVQLA